MMGLLGVLVVDARVVPLVRDEERPRHGYSRDPASNGVTTSQMSLAAR